MNIRKTTRTAKSGKQYVYFVLRFTDPEGRPRTKYFASMREARAAAPKLLTHVAEGTYNAKADSITVGELITAWRQADYSPQRTEKIRTATRISYESALVRILARWRAVRLTTIQVSHIEQWRNELQAEGAGNATVAKALTVLTMLFRFAQRDHLATANPAALVRQPSIGTRRALAFAPAQLPQLFAACTGRMRVAVMLAGLTGARRGEILGLRWGAVDLEGRQIHIREQWTGRDKETSVLKTEAGRRTVAIPAMLAAELMRWKLAQRPELKRPESFVLTSASGCRPVDPANFTTAWHKALKRAQLPPRPFHCLRHTAGTALVSSDTPPGVVHRVLGHTNFATTLKLYGGTTATALEAAATALENALTPAVLDKSGTKGGAKP